VVALIGIVHSYFTAGPESGVREHPAQIYRHLLIDVFASRSFKHFCLRPQSHGELSVVFFGGGSEILEQRQSSAPLDVAARRMIEDPVDRQAVMTTQVGGH
jgi:hypothetical protein